MGHDILDLVGHVTCTKGGDVLIPRAGGGGDDPVKLPTHAKLPTHPKPKNFPLGKMKF